MSKKLKQSKRQNPFARRILVQFKVNAEEMRVILGKAHAFTKGNISLLARYSTLNFVPKKGDFE